MLTSLFDTRTLRHPVDPICTTRRKSEKVVQLLTMGAVSMKLRLIVRPSIDILAIRQILRTKRTAWARMSLHSDGRDVGD